MEQTWPQYEMRQIIRASRITKFTPLTKTVTVKKEDVEVPDGALVEVEASTTPIHFEQHWLNANRPRDGSDWTDGYIRYHSVDVFTFCTGQFFESMYQHLPAG